MLQKQNPYTVHGMSKGTREPNCNKWSNKTGQHWNTTQVEKQLHESKAMQANDGVKKHWTEKMKQTQAETFPVLRPSTVTVESRLPSESTPWKGEEEGNCMLGSMPHTMCVSLTPVTKIPVKGHKVGWWWNSTSVVLLSRSHNHSLILKNMLNWMKPYSTKCLTCTPQNYQCHQQPGNSNQVSYPRGTCKVHWLNAMWYPVWWVSGTEKQRGGGGLRLKIKEKCELWGIIMHY